MIKEYRKKKKLTQEQLAEILNLSTRHLQRIEKDETCTSIKTLITIKELLDIPDEELVKIFHKNKDKITS